MKRFAFLAALVVATAAFADEGMWLLNNFPGEKVSSKYGFKPTQEWLNHVQLSAARLAKGCSGSFVSANGLVMTNHHCAERCIEEISTGKKDYMQAGFYAKSQAEEPKCPDVEINELLEITDVTDQINKAVSGKEGADFNTALKAEQAKIEKACATADNLRCDVMSLYHGGKYHLYKYRRFTDVRLVFAPEFAMAFFGGDPDNFEFPRYDFDVTFFRVYENNKPVAMDHYFKWSPTGPKENEVAFIAGNPGSTNRESTVAQLEYQRDVALPRRLFRIFEMRGLLTQFAQQGPEQKRISHSTLFYTENSAKALKGRFAALADKQFFNQIVQREQDLRSKVNADPKRKAAYGAAWDNIAKAQARMKEIYVPYTFLEERAGFNSELFSKARQLVRAAAELPKPNEQRLREYTEAQFPATKNALLSPAPIYDEFEILTLTWSLTKLREELGSTDPFVKKVLGKESPRELATRLVKTSKLRNPSVRKALLEGGQKAVDASNDPMIQLAKLVDPDARAVRKIYEEEVDSVLKKNGELIARARFEIYGTNVYPDATLTLRLSYGAVTGWTEPDGKKVPAFTTIGGLYDHATGKDPFALPPSWSNAKPKLNLETTMNMSTSNDIIGGNSGSPVINKDAQIIGLVFDGNIHSLGGDYAYEGATNRAVSVTSSALMEGLEKVYGAKRVVSELRGEGGGSTTGGK